MRHFLIYLAVVTLLSSALAANEVNVSPGHVYEVNLLVEYPVDGSSWAGVYGALTVGGKYDASYFSGPFGYFTISPSDVNDITSSVQLYSNPLSVPDLNNWYIVFSPRDDLNWDQIVDTCDANLDAAIEGNFCFDCTPNKTFTNDENISINDANHCAAGTVIYGGVPTYVLLTPEGNTVYASSLGDYVVMGQPAHFGTLISVPGPTTLYVYLVRKHVFCGDNVCDPGEASANCSDCISIYLSVSPSSRDANVDQPVSFSGTIRNDGLYGVTVNSLGVEVVSGDANAVSASVSPSGWSLPRYFVPGDEQNFSVTVSASSPGDYTLRVVANGTYRSNEFTLHVVSPPPPPEENAPTEGGGGIPPEENVTEENAPIQLETGGFYIPWAKCISNVKLSGPDRVNAKLEENVNVGIFVQNGGTCEENITFAYSIRPEENAEVIPSSLTLRPGEGRRITFHVMPKSSGLHRVTIEANGVIVQQFNFDIFVSKERAGPSERECESDITVVAPDKLVVVEGEDINRIVIMNAGTCREDVSIQLVKRVDNVDITLDKKAFGLSPGENYYYRIPRLVAGQYYVYIKAGPVEKTSEIRVTPKPLFQGVTDLMTRGRVAVFALLVFLLIVLAAYVRYRYIR